MPRLAARSLAMFFLSAFGCLAGCRASEGSPSGKHAPAGTSSVGTSSVGTSSVGTSSSTAGSARAVGSVASAATSGLHPALAGHPPEYWIAEADRSNRAQPSALEPPAEAYGRTMRYRGPLQEHRGVTSICERLRAGPGTIAVVGLNWNRVPWSQKRGDRRVAELELDGTLQRDRFTVKAVRRWRPAPPNEEPQLPCPEPAPKARIRDASRVSPDHSRAAIEYAQSQPEFVAVWSHWMIPEARRNSPGKSHFEAEDGVLAFKFTEGLEAHRAEIQRLYGGSVCVAQGTIQHSVQQAITRRAALLLQTEGTQHGRLDCAFGVSFDGKRERLQVGALAWDPVRLASWLSRELAGVPVDVQSALMPL